MPARNRLNSMPITNRWSASGIGISLQTSGSFRRAFAGSDCRQQPHRFGAECRLADDFVDLINFVPLAGKRYWAAPQTEGDRK